MANKFLVDEKCTKCGMSSKRISKYDCCDNELELFEHKMNSENGIKKRDFCSNCQDYTIFILNKMRVWVERVKRVEE